jgi:NCS1 family nucleobase:cation symporter-1
MIYADSLTFPRIYAFAWLYGFFTSLPTYYIICKYISPQTVSLLEEAVYPPGKDESPASPLEGSAIGEDLKETVVTEKETSPV